MLGTLSVYQLSTNLTCTLIALRMLTTTVTRGLFNYVVQLPLSKQTCSMKCSQRLHAPTVNTLSSRRVCYYFHCMRLFLLVFTHYYLPRSNPVHAETLRKILS